MGSPKIESPRPTTPTATTDAGTATNGNKARHRLTRVASASNTAARPSCSHNGTSNTGSILKDTTPSGRNSANRPGTVPTTANTITTSATILPTTSSTAGLTRANSARSDTPGTTKRRNACHPKHHRPAAIN